MTLAPAAITIRAARPEDAPAIRRVHESSIRGLGPAAYTAAEVDSWVGVLTDLGYVQAMMLGGEVFIVADSGSDGVVGFCSWSENEVKGLYVSPGWARRGIGRALVGIAEAAIAAAGHPSVRVGSSLVGEAFYAALGYVALRRAPWTTRGGLIIETIDMEKPLAGRRGPAPAPPLSQDTKS